MAAQPAFHSVAARQTLQRHVDSKPVSTTQDTPWGPDVRAYVQRAFEFQVDGVSVSEMQARLKQVITTAAEQNTISSTDWSTYPLPQQLILAERASVPLMFPPPPHTRTPIVPVGMPPGYGSMGPPSTFATNSTLGKRKSTELDPAGEPRAVTPPWKKPNTKANLADRITGGKKKQKKAALRDDIPANNNSDALARRRQRFGHVPTTLAPWSGSESTNVTPDGPVVGTAQQLEKNYFRLTAAPKPVEVRPLPVLKEMMNLLRKKWKAEHNYAYACDQFKSMRQDLTVQHIKNDFTVVVYEAHARIALEMGDMGEYNQCQTQLRALYKSGLVGRREEFTAYRILYFIYTCNRADMNDALADLTQSEKQMEAVKHALQVRAALASGNYHRFFRLYSISPYMGAYIIDKFIGRERLAALAAICKTYKPDVPLDFLVRELAFQGEEEDPDHGSRACVQFICDHGGEHLISQKDDGSVRFLSGQAKGIFESARAQAFSRVDIKGQI